MLKRQLAVTGVQHSERAARRDGVQLQGAIDDLYAYDGPLGADFGRDGEVTLRVWAPTARR